MTSLSCVHKWQQCQGRWRQQPNAAFQYRANMVMVIRQSRLGFKGTQPKMISETLLRSILDELPWGFLLRLKFAYRFTCLSWLVQFSSVNILCIYFVCSMANLYWCIVTCIYIFKLTYLTYRSGIHFKQQRRNSDFIWRKYIKVFFETSVGLFRILNSISRFYFSTNTRSFICQEDCEVKRQY